MFDLVKFSAVYRPSYHPNFLLVDQPALNSVGIKEGNSRMEMLEGTVTHFEDLNFK